MTKRAEQTNGPVAVVRNMLTDEKMRRQLQDALPRHIPVDRMIRVAMTTMQTNPALWECDTKSILGAIMEAAQLGIEPDGILGHAYLVPYYNGKRKCKECKLIVGYRGLIALSRRSGEIKSLSATVVYENDHFKYRFGLSEDIDHVPAEGERGEMTHVYAIAKFKDGGHQFEVMTVADVEKIRGMSKAGDFGPWKDHFEEMARKTVTRKLCKYLPASVLQKAATIDEYSDFGVGPAPNLLESNTSARTEALKEKLGSMKDGSGEGDAETSEPPNGDPSAEEAKRMSDLLRVVEDDTSQTKAWRDKWVKKINAGEITEADFKSIYKTLGIEQGELIKN